MWCLVYLGIISMVLHLQLVEDYSAKAVTNALTSAFAISNLSQKITSNIQMNLTKSSKLIMETGDKEFCKDDLKVIKATWPQKE